ncbi:MAG: signal peptidase I [Acidimicrobiales bacterium]
MPEPAEDTAEDGAEDMTEDGAPAPGSASQDSAPEATAGEAAGPGTPVPPRRSWRSHLTGWAIPIAVAVIVAFLLRTFVISAFYIPSGSMIPTLDIGDRILVDRLSPDMGGIHMGDIMVFHRTKQTLCGSAAETYLVKRVIGLPGDRVSSQGNNVLVNGKVLSQPWLPAYDPLGRPITTQVVPPHEYFMLGDNRSESCDSRYWGDVPRSNMVGRVILLFWPLSRLRFF